MANAKRTSLRKSRIVENRNQRTTAPVQPGAGNDAALTALDRDDLSISPEQPSPHASEPE